MNEIQEKEPLEVRPVVLNYKKGLRIIRRMFLPFSFVAILMLLGIGTFGLHINTFIGEIGWVQKNCQGNFIAKADMLIERWQQDAAQELFLQERLVEIDGLAARFFDKHFVRDTDYSYSVVRDNHGWLQFITFAGHTPEVVQNIEDYKKLNVPILYVQPPTKYIDGYTEFPPTLHDQTAANAANTVKLLAEAGVPYIDLRAFAERDGLDKEKMFYRTDHHWRVETAFWAVGRTVQTLNQLLGWKLDAEGFYCNQENWQQQTWQGNFLGSQGRRVGRFYAGVDDFTLITPNFETSFLVSVKQQDGARVQRRGTFEEVLLDWDILNSSNIYSNRYGAYWGADYPSVMADNLQNNNGKTVLIIKDSYSLPFGAFMATMVDKLYMVDLRYFAISELANYIKEIAPDVILIMYS